MHVNFITLIILVLAFFMSGPVGMLRAEAWEAVPFEQLNDKPSRGEDWLIIAGDDAFNAGLTSLAENFYRKAFEQSDKKSKQYKDAGVKLGMALISQQKFSEARKVLKFFKAENDPSVYLQRAWLAFRDDDTGLLRRLLRLIHTETLDVKEQPWYYLLSGLYHLGQGNALDAEKAFQQATQQALVSQQVDLFRSVILREKIFQGTVSEEMAKELEASLANPLPSDIMYLKIREYAVVLDILGRKSEAVSFIESMLDKPNISASTTDQLLLLLSYIAGPESERGQYALQRILKSSSNRMIQSKALSLLTSSEFNKADDVQSRLFLDNLIKEYAKHSLLDELYLLRARLAHQSGNYEQAEGDIDIILKDFPGSPLRISALRLKAYLAWDRKPSQLRNVADILRQIQKEEVNPAEHARLGVLIADSYFLNGDNKSASDAYASAIIEHVTLSLPIGSLVFQQVLADIRAGRIDMAMDHLDEASQLEMDAAFRWKSEWNLISAMKREGLIDEAFERIQLLLQSTSDDMLPLELRLRLMWLKAQLSYETGYYKAVPALVDQVLTTISEAGEDALTAENRISLAGQVLLLKANAQLAQGLEDDFQGTWAELRMSYPDSEAAALSYLEEARYCASLDRTVEALQQCIVLVDKYPKSSLAPIALYEAAHYAELRGQELGLENGISLLERLVTEYPESSLFYYARLKQADILRNMNRFGAAQLIYENLLVHHSNHPESGLAELNRAKCLFALGHKDPDKGDLAIARFEYLFDLNYLPADLRIEAGYHWAFALISRQDTSRGQEVLWMLVSRFLIQNKEYMDYTYKGRYWLSRSVFDLGDLLERNNQVEEAQQVYSLILSMGLPGKALASLRLSKYSE